MLLLSTITILPRHESYFRTDQVEDFTIPPIEECKSFSVDAFATANQYSIFPNPADNLFTIKVSKTK